MSDEEREKTLTRAELEADFAFLLARSSAAGSCRFGGKRWTGMSSNSLVAFAYGGKQDRMPSDRNDYGACVRTYVRLPKHRRTAAVRAALKKAREAYLSNYPDERFAGPRNAARAAWEAEAEKRQKRRRRRRRRAA